MFTRRVYREQFLALSKQSFKKQSSSGHLGWAWIVVAPLLLLGVYTLVFGYIFQARVPSDIEVPFVAWLATALWPWLAFSESTLRGSQAIRAQAGLIAKIALLRAMFPVSTQTATFFLHMAGYMVVLLALLVYQVPLTLVGLPYLVLVLFTLYLFALGLGLLLSALLVYVRDLDQFLPLMFMLWFFLTPILYSPELLPGGLGAWLNLNPMTWWMNEIRAALFQGQWLPGLSFLALLGASMLSLILGKVVFDRLSPHFEDFL